MKASNAPVGTPIMNQKETTAKPWIKWFEEVADSAMVERTDAAVSPTAPSMKKGEMLVFKATASAKTFLVYYDGTDRYYWESSGKNIY